MPRNSSGTYTLPIGAFSPGGLIKSNDHNSNYSDIATALTQSVASTGVTPMTGPLLGASGNVTTPSHTFNAAPTTGLYLAGTNQIGWAAAGAQGATFNSDTSVTWAGPHTIQGRPVTTFDVGTAILFQQSTAPTAWTKVVTYNDYALRVVSGTAGTGGSTAFSTVFAASRTITQANLPNVNFNVTDPGHGHTTNASLYQSNGQPGGTGGTNFPFNPTGATINSSTTGISVNSGGSGTGLNFAVNYVDCIIATKN